MNHKHLAFVGNSAKMMYNFRLGVMKSCVEAGYDVTVIAVEDFDIQRFTEIGIHFMPISIDCHGTHILNDLRSICQLYTIYRKRHYDMIFHFTIKPVIYGGIVARLLKLKHIDVITGLGMAFINRTIVTRLVERLYKFSLHSALEGWFLNEDDRQLFLQSHLLSEKKARLLPGEGVDTTLFTPQTSVSPTFTFLYLGRLLWAKGVGEYVEAARIIHRQYPETVFNLLGGFYSATDITPTTIKKWETEGTIRYLGETNNVIPYLADADCIVLPSYREGVPRSLMEAAAMEKPIITTDMVGCREVVKDNINGYLCKVKDTKSLSLCMNKMLNLSEQERTAMGQRGRQLIVEQFDERIIIDIYHKTLQHYLSC